ncbi:BBE domain-containing protein [Streptomyces sp. NPDC046977]|uniref:BBE domain-containing protein n=1 Tax=Streptomyces sp. NPDC046977 TaxID=3154703 RepID=UPI0033DA4C08
MRSRPGGVAWEKCGGSGRGLYETDHAATVLRAYRGAIAAAPERLCVFPAFHIAPPLPFIPEGRHGDRFVGLVACWAGPPEEGERVLRPFRDAAPVAAEHVGPMPYPVMNSLFDAILPPGLQHYWKAAFAAELTDQAIAAHVAHAPGLPAVNTAVHIYPIDRACHRVAPDTTAFAYRDVSFVAVIAGMRPDAAANDANIAWVRGYYEAIAPHSQEGRYVNFTAGDDQGRVRANYRGDHDRPVEVKRARDPGNLFHLNQNIRP